MAAVLQRLSDRCIEDPDTAQEIAEKLDDFLDSFGDLFGTEGQLDPRGDQRDKEWTMERVQGIDAK